MPNTVDDESPSFDDPASEVSVSNDINSSKNTDLSPSPVPKRDEVKEIERASKKDTDYIRAWRYLLILTLSATACAVTLTTYRFLEENQTDSYKESVRRSIQN